MTYTPQGVKVNAVEHEIARIEARAGPGKTLSGSVLVVVPVRLGLAACGLVEVV